MSHESISRRLVADWKHVLTLTRARCVVAELPEILRASEEMLYSPRFRWARPGGSRCGTYPIPTFRRASPTLRRRPSLPGPVLLRHHLGGNKELVRILVEKPPRFVDELVVLFAEMPVFVHVAVNRQEWCGRGRCVVRILLFEGFGLRLFFERFVREGRTRFSSVAAFIWCKSTGVHEPWDHMRSRSAPWERASPPRRLTPR